MGYLLINLGQTMVPVHLVGSKLILIPPATKETKAVPQSQISYPQGKACFQDLGFGFDIKSNENKMVMILESYDHLELSFYEIKKFSVAKVYCLSTNQRWLQEFF